MHEDEFFALIDPALRLIGAVAEEGETLRDPPLDVLRYYARRVRFSWIPLLGRALSVVTVVRQPTDLGVAGDGDRKLLARVARAVDGRFPPLVRGRGVSVGLTCVVLAPEPIGPDDDARLRTALGRLPRSRAVPLGLIRINLDQGAMAFALAGGPDGLFPEPEALVDALTARFLRFVPPPQF